MIQLLFITQLLEVNILELKCSVTVAFAAVAFPLSRSRRSLETTAKDGRKKAQRTLSFSAPPMFLVLDSKILISNDELGLIDLQKIITETVSKLSDI